MSGPSPLDFLYKDKSTGAKTTPVQQLQQTEASKLDFLYNKPTEQLKPAETGLVNYVGNFAKNWFNQGAIRSVETFLDPIGFARIGEDPSALQAAKDMAHIFDYNFSTPINAAISIGQSFGASGEAAKGNMLSGLAIGVIKPVVDLGELSSGLKLTDEDVRPLTPEEKTERIKASAGLIISSAVAGPLSTVLKAPIGGIAGRMLTSAGVGSVAGGIYGSVSSAGNKDELAQLIAGTMTGGLLGVVHGLLPERSTNGLKASEVDLLRKAQVENNSIPQVQKLAQAFATNDDVAAALIDGRIGLQSNDIHIVPGINAENLALVQSKLPEGYRSVVHVDPKTGEGKLLVYDTRYTGLSGDEKIVNSAVQIGNRFFEGADHSTAARSAARAGVDYNDQSLYFKAGFKTDKGRFVPYDEAYAIARKANQVPDLPEAAANGLSSEDLVHRIKDYGTKPVGNTGLREQIKGEFTPKSYSLDESFFQQTGFLRDQRVSIDGNDSFKIIGTSEGKINIRNVNGNYNLSVDPAEIRSLPNTYLDTEKASDLIYGQWKNSLEGSVNPKIKGEIDNSKPASILDLVPDLHQVDIKQHIDGWLKAQGFSPEDRIQVSNDFQRKLAGEAAIRLEPTEREVIANVQKETPKQRVLTLKNLDQLARTNGYSVSDGGSGRVVVRDLESNRIIRGFDTHKDAEKWINGSGQATGPKLDDNTTIDTQVAGGGKGPPSDESGVAYANDDVHNFIGKRKGEGFFTFLNNAAIITRYQDWMKKLDTDYGTNVYNRVFDNLHKAFNIRNARLNPYAERLAGIKNRYKFSESEWEKVGQYMETMTPEEVVYKYMARPMNPFEIQQGRELARSQVDVERVFRYRRELEKLDQEYPITERADQQVEGEYQNHLKAMQEAFSLGQRELDWANQFDQIEKMNMKDASLGAIVRLARSIDNGTGIRELSRSEFATKHKLSFEQIKAANELSEMYQKLAKVFGISEERQLTQYNTHARLYMDGDIGRTIKHFSGDVKTRDFYAKLARTGEVSAFETNPALAMQRYLKAGFDSHSGFYESVANAKSAMREELQKISDSGKAKHAEQVIGRYIESMQGFPAAADRAAQTAIENLAKEHKWIPEIDLRRWVNASTSLVANATLGFRPFLGITHLGISTIISTAARSHAYTMRVLLAGGKALANHDIMQSLQERGVLAGLSPLATMSKVEYAGTFKGGVGKVQDALFKSTLLPTAYDGLAAGHYITANADALSALTRFNRKEITWNQLKKEVFLDRFDAPVVQRFTELTHTPQVAADYLGRQAIEDLVGTYGAGSHPDRWNTNAGRIAGQFGNFAMFVRGAWQRIASRGTVADRVNGVAKLAAYSYAAHKLEEESGINLTRMSPFHAMWWMAGPGINVAEDVVNAFKATGYTQQSAIRRLQKILPWDFQKNEPQSSLLLPGSYGIDGVLQAIQDITGGQVGLGLGELLGFRRTQKQQEGGL